MGAGINLFKTLFPSDYYPYTANTLMSAKPTGKKIIGFNQFDEQTELGSIDSSGNKISHSSIIRSKNYIPCFPNTEYYACGANIVIYFYDSSYNMVIYSGYGAYNNGADILNHAFTIPNGACYMLFRFSSDYGTTYKNDLCLNISDNAKNGTYEPYLETTIAYSGNELRGLLKVGTNGLYSDGDIDDGSGSTEVRYEERAYQSGDESLANAITDGTNTVIKKATPTTATSTAWSNPIKAAAGGAEEFTDNRTIKMPTGHDTIYSKKTGYRYWR